MKSGKILFPNIQAKSHWSFEIDLRLKTLFKHVYDLKSTLFVVKFLPQIKFRISSLSARMFFSIIAAAFYAEKESRWGISLDQISTTSIVPRPRVYLKATK